MAACAGAEELRHVGETFALGLDIVGCCWRDLAGTLAGKVGVPALDNVADLHTSSSTTTLIGLVEAHDPLGAGAVALPDAGVAAVKG